MMKISKTNISQIKEVYIHDAEIGQIINNYRKSQLVISLKEHLINGGTRFSNLIFNEVVFYLVSDYDPWGSGIYVFSLSAETSDKYFDLLESKELNAVFGIDRIKKEENPDSYLGFNLLLNSGDKIIIGAKELEYEIVEEGNEVFKESY